MYSAPTHIAAIQSDLDAINAQRDELRAKAKAIKAKLDAELVNEQCDHWGLTPEQYAAAKADARERGVLTHVALNDARRKANRERREAQTATILPVSVGVGARPAGPSP